MQRGIMKNRRGQDSRQEVSYSAQKCGNRSFSLCNFLPENRKGTILVENVIFIILNILFITILILFISRQGSGAVVLEQSYAKNIALLIDASQPVSEMKLYMKDAIDVAEKNGISREEIVKISGNSVLVKLSANGGYQYSFFNNVDATAYPDIYTEKNYVIKINGYK